MTDDPARPVAADHSDELDIPGPLAPPDTAPNVDVDVDEKPKRKRFFSFSFLKLLGFLAWTAGVLGLGVSGGYRLAERVAEEQPDPVSIQVVAAEASTAGTDEVAAGSVVMPDIVGLTVDEAMEALVDSGIPPSAVIQNQAAWVGEADRVVTQRPVHGSPDPGAVFLGVSVGAEVPDVIGLPVEQALAQLQSIGIVPLSERRYEPGVEPGTVLATDPPSGSPAPERLTITSASAPSAAYLTAIRATTRDCSARDDQEIGGRTYVAAVTCRVRPTSDEPEVQTYAIEGLADGFRATAGLIGSAADGAAARLTIKVDGTVVETIDLVPSRNASIDLPLTGAQEISFEFEVTGGEDTVDTFLGDPFFLGDPVALEVLSS